MDSFGASVALLGDNALSGAPISDSIGAVYQYSRNRGGAENWGEVEKWESSDPVAGNVGSAISVWNRTAEIGAPTSNTDAQGAGAVYNLSLDAPYSHTASRPPTLLHRPCRGNWQQNVVIYKKEQNGRWNYLLQTNHSSVYWRSL